jgi:RNA-binding protein YhbY
MVRDRRELARVWATEKPSVRIGKAGVNERVIAEVKRQLKRKPLIKVRVLPSAILNGSLDQLITELVTHTSCVVCGRRGWVVVLSRKSS